MSHMKHFCPHVTIRGRVGEISEYKNSFTYDQTFGIYLMALPCAAADSRVLIKKKKETRKRGNCECIATSCRPTPRQSFTALIMTSCQVKSLNLSFAILWRLCCWYITWPRDLDLWPLSICNVSPVTWWNSVPNLNTVEQSAALFLRFQYLT